MKRWLLVFAVALLLVFAGCAGDEGSDDTGDVADDSAEELGENTDEEAPTDDTPEEDDDNDSAGADDDPPPDDTNTDTDSGENDGSDGSTGDTPVDGVLEVHSIHVGQGDARLLVGPSGDTILIDSGDWTDDGEDVIAYLDAQEITRIDHFVTTHPDADHIGGHAAIIEYFETKGDGIGAVYDPGITSSSATYESYLEAIETHDVTHHR